MCRAILTNLSPFDIAVYGCELIIFSFAVLAMATANRVRPNVAIGRTAGIIAAQGLVYVYFYGLQYCLLGDPCSACAFLGALSYVAAGGLILINVSWYVLAPMLAIGTVPMMQAARLQLYVQGSQFNYEATPWFDWMVQGVILVTLLVASRINGAR